MLYERTARVFIVHISFSRYPNTISNHLESRQDFTFWATDIVRIEGFIGQSTIMMLGRRILSDAGTARIGRQ